MLITHKTFLCWLIYITTLVFAVVGATLVGLPQLIVTYDHSHLSLVILAGWLVAEVLTGIQVVAASRLHRQVADVRAWFGEYVLTKMTFPLDVVVLTGEAGVSEKIPNHVYEMANSAYGDHLYALWRRAYTHPDDTRPGALDQTILLEALADRLHDRVSTTEFLASRIVWLGILATILGVILAFWPFVQVGLTIEAIRGNLQGFFAGVAVAFIPTAVSFVAKIALDTVAEILRRGVDETLDMITVDTESHVIPYLEQRGEIDLRQKQYADRLAHIQRASAAIL